jgi:ankyrin repeat protein
MVKLLLKGGADVDIKDSKGRMPLWYAAASGNEAMVKLLIKVGPTST